MQPSSPTRPRLPWVRAVGLAGLTALLAALAGCGADGAASAAKTPKTKPQRPVELAQAERRPLEYFVETVGVLEAEGKTDIAAGVSGVVDEVLFREGQWVERGSILVKVDQRRYIAAAEVARANEKRALAMLELARDLDYRARIAGRAVSDEERAKASLGLRTAEADLAAAVAARILAENNLERSQVRAPYAGQINQRLVTPGMYCEDKTPVATMADVRQLRLVAWVPEKAAATVRELLARQELARAMQLVAACGAGPTPWGAVADIFRDGTAGGLSSWGRHVTELHYAVRIFAGCAASPWTALAEAGRERWSGSLSGYGLEYTVGPFPDRPLLGRIFYLSTVASPDTHMFECKAEANSAGLGIELKPGYTARIRVPLRSNPNACVIPEEAVRASERGFVAFVPELRQRPGGSSEWVARARLLELGYRARGLVEVRGGLKPGDWIVVKGAEALEDGTPIRAPEGQLEQITRRR
ncbi:MAG TPA: efflux RND transporter periplasmic adaptor subunit [Gemmataceae bacterium]|nr:efflux RND transporter periplasmic adaptor subunit [Gemmataceae bacterium]